MPTFEILAVEKISVSIGIEADSIEEARQKFEDAEYESTHEETLERYIVKIKPQGEDDDWQESQEDEEEEDA